MNEKTLSKILNSIIIRGKTRGLCKELGYEIHHIIPRALGGSDVRENLVKLTHREHWLVHVIMSKINPDCEVTNLTAKIFKGKGCSREFSKQRLLFQMNCRLPENRKRSSESMKRFNDHLWNSPDMEDSRVRAIAALQDPRSRDKVTQSNIERYKNESPELRKKKYGTQKGQPKPRVTCNKCGLEVSVNTLKRHKRSLHCTPRFDIVKMYKAGISSTEIGKLYSTTTDNAKRIVNLYIDK